MTGMLVRLEATGENTAGRTGVELLQPKKVNKNRSKPACTTWLYLEKRGNIMKGEMENQVLSSLGSSLILAAKIKSFSDNPPMEWVAKSMRNFR